MPASLEGSANRSGFTGIAAEGNGDMLISAPAIIRGVKGARGQQKMKRILRPEFELEFDADLQNLAWLGQETICHNVIKQIPSILDIAFYINRGLKLVRGDRLVRARIKTNCVRGETDWFLVGIAHPVFNFDVHKNENPKNNVWRSEACLGRNSISLIWSP